MPERKKRHNIGRLDAAASFLMRFIPWLALHITAGLCIGSLYAIKFEGAEGAVRYYYPPLIAALAGAVLAGWSYFAFGRAKPEYDISRLSHFDRGLIYGHFSGRDAAYLREAVIDMHMNDMNASLEKLKDLEEQDLFEDRRSVVCFYMGRCYQLMGYPANGSKYFSEALDLGLKLNDTYLLAARCLTQNGRFDEAIAYYNILLERDCYFDFIYTDMGIAYLKKGESEKALEMFGKAVEEGKNYAFALGGCSLAYLQMKDLEKSREYYKKALENNMDDVSGFKIFYCNIAEAADMLDKIDPSMKIRPDIMEKVMEKAFGEE